LFRRALEQHPQGAAVARIQVTLFGSLAWTGKGHATDKAVLLGLNRYLPEAIDPDEAERRLADIKAMHRLSVATDHAISFDPEHDIVFDLERIVPGHSNTLAFAAFDRDGRLLMEETWYSVGGGFIVRAGEEACVQTVAPYSFQSAATSSWPRRRSAPCAR
jgi:L-serine dehydratase